MWNKLFKKKQSKSANKSQNDAPTKQTTPPASTTTFCFSFRGAKKPNNDHYNKMNENFQYFQHESEIYRKPDYNRRHEYSQLYQPVQHRHPDENQQLNEIFIEIPQPNIRLDLCPVCSRKFAPETLLKHVIICEKINTKKRKPFDSSKQRLNGTEFASVSATSSPVATNRLTPSRFESRVSPPKTLQRKLSETSLKSQPATSTSSHYNMSRKNSSVSLGGGTPRLSVKRSLVQQNEKCPYCERNFGFKAYDRHVEWCKEKSLIKPSPDTATVSAAKERMKTRITYKAPCLKTKRTTTREKYSNSCNGSTNSLADFDSHLNSMSSSMTSEHGLYDPFLSAKKQLEELFTPTSSTPTTQMINSMMVPTTPSSEVNKVNNINNDIMSKSLTLTSQAVNSPKTPQPIPKMQSNFKRTSSLRISNRKPKPTIYTPPVKSNIHCGITDDGPISPNFVKATDYDELPIKSPYSAIKMCEKNLKQNQVMPLRVSPARASPSPTMPSINQPILRDKNAALTRKNLKLDIRNPNKPLHQDYPLSKTDSLALFLKYENELTAKLSEKEMKDKSNSLSKRSQATNNLTSVGLSLDHKLPDINHGISTTTPQPTPRITNGKSFDERNALISIDNFHKNPQENINEEKKSHSAPVKTMNACDNLPELNNGNNVSDKSRSPSMDRKTGEEESPQSGRRSALRRQKKYNIDNILFGIDNEQEVKSTTPSSGSDNSNNNSLIRPTSRTSNTESIFEDFDFDQFIASFNDDDQFPIFKDYKALLNKTVNDDNSNKPLNDTNKSQPEENPFGLTKNLVDTKPIPIQQPQRSEAELSGLEKLDNLCKMLSGNSDSDESNSLETDSQAIRSKSSADSAYGSLSSQSRQSQSPFDHRKMTNNNFSTFRPTPPPPPIRQHLELKTTEIVLNPVKPPYFQETIMIPRNGNVLLNRSTSTESSKSDAPYSKFCHECGYKFVVPTAKFCIECGVRRIKMV
ncbi:CLUMA_CG021347, isoform A [Clunio marinus]|uniref:CLUMA_CG021347, isoform A n=1 Tax=Clunio marinus TaxID=568069 RepID=A0A1J1J8C1_9DIPT|nr:CLUMA_CG021347, isoform A [Clunio marinus]